MIKKLKFLTIALFFSNIFYYAGSDATTDAIKVKHNYEKQKNKNRFFIENKGQWPEEVLFLTRMGGMDAWITKKGVVFDFYKLNKVKKTVPENQKGIENPLKDVEDYSKMGHAVSMEHVNANPKARGEGKGKQTAYYNYFIGNDPSKWASYVGLYDEAIVKDVYPGIDQRWYFDNGYLRFDYEVNPGADVSAIKIKLKGQNSYDIQNNILKFNTRFGDISIKNLTVYQKNKIVNTQLRINSYNEVIFNLNNYNKAEKLIIDPLIYSSFMGGNTTEYLNSSSIDNNQNLIIVGSTYSSNYPVSFGSYDVSFNGNQDGFISKFSPTLNSLIFSTFIGGSAVEDFTSVDIDNSNNIYVTGSTTSTNYPVTIGVVGSTYALNGDVVITVLNSSGSSLNASTYFGGSSGEVGDFIKVQSGNVYVCGTTLSTNFSVTPSCYDNTHNGNNDGFYLSLNTSLNAINFSSFLGGTAYDRAYSLSIDGFGNIIIAGYTGSTNFPVTAGVLDQTYNSGGDIVISKFNASGNALLASTFIGQSNTEIPYILRVLPTGNYLIGGTTSSTNYSVTAGCYDNTYNGGGSDCILTIVNSNLNTLIASTFIGGGSNDYLEDLVIEPISNNVYIVGYSYSSNYPVTSNAFSSTLNGSGDAIISQLNNNLSSLLFSTYLGGANSEVGTSIHTTSTNEFIVTGYTDSGTFPVSSNAYQPIIGSLSANDGFIFKYLITPLCTPPSLSLTSGTITCLSHTVSVSNTITSNPPTTTYTWSGPGIISGVNSQTAQVHLPGIYTLTAQDGTCITTQTIYVPHDASIPSLSLSVTNNLDCIGNNTASVIATGTVPPPGSATYTWSGPNIISGNGTQTIEVGASGVYTCAVIPALNPACYNSGTIAVLGSTAPITPTVTKSNDVNCYTNQVTLTVLPAGMSYTWTAPVNGTIISGSNSQTAVVTISGGGIFNVNVEDPNAPGCIGTGGISVLTNTTPPTGTLTAPLGTIITCAQPTLNIIANTTPVTATVSWSGPGIVSGGTTKTVVVNAAGIYTALITNTLNGCTATRTMQISGNTTPPIITSFGGTKTCSNPTPVIGVQPNTPAYTYTWTAPPTATIITPANLATVAVNNGGVFTVVVTSTANGCSTTTFVGVSTNTTPPSVILTPSSFTVCTAQTISLTGTPSGGVYSGSFVTGNLFTPTSAGVYTVAYTYTSPTNGCTNQAVQSLTASACAVANDLCSGAYTLSVPSLTTGSTTGATTDTPPFCSYVGNPSGPGVWYAVTGTGGYIAANVCSSNFPAQIFLYSGTCAQLTNLTCAQNNSLSSLCTGASGAQVSWCSQVGVTYYLLVTTGSTPGNFTLNITSPTQPSITVNATPPGTICAGNSATLSVTSAPFSTTFTWNPGNHFGSTYIVSPSVTTQYTVQSNSAVSQGVYGCVFSGVYTQSVVPFSGPTVSVSATPNPICQNNTATLSASGVSTYTWSTGHTVPTITQFYSSTGTYNYTVTGTNSSGCKSSAAIQVTVNPSASFFVSGANITCSTPQPTLYASNSSLNYTWTAPVSGSIVGSPNNSFVVVAAPGNYSVVGVNSSGCSYSMMISVGTNTTPPTVNLTASQYTVCTTNSVVLNGSPFGGVYSASCCLSGNVLTPTAAGVYTVTYTYTNTSNGCTNQAVTTITANTFAGPSVSVSAVQNPICAGNNATLIGSGVSSYTWNTGSTSATITPYFSSSGIYNYTVSGTNSSGCKSSAAIQVTVNTGSAFSISGNNITCYTSQPTLVASNASYNYTWTAPPSGTILTSPNAYSIVVGGPGTYTAVSSNSTGCTYTNYYTVSTNTTPPTVNLTASQYTVCTTNSVVLSGSPFGGVYSAACCLSGNVLTPTAAGVYTVTYTFTNTVNGCTNQAVTTITANTFAGPSVSVSAVQNPICAGNNATLIGSGVSSYTWNTGSNSATINPYFSSSGTYNYTVSGTNGFGCISSAALQMTVNPGAVFSISGNNITCATSQPTLYASNSSLSYTWNAPVSGSIVGSPNNSFVVVAAPGTYTALATNSAGCTYSTTYAVSINTTPPSVNLQPSQYTVCTTNTIQLYGSPSGGVYNAPCCLVGSIFTPTAAGVYTLSYSYTNSVNGCSNQAAITVTANTFSGPSVSVNAVQNPICAGNNATLIGSGVSSYTWNNGSNSATITPYLSSSGVYNYTVSGTNSSGCKSSAAIQVTVNNTPFFTVNNTNIGCTTPNATLTASNGSYNYTWTAPPTGTIISGNNSSVAIVTGTGVYSVTASSGAGCTYSTVVSVSSTTSQAVSISGSSITCTTPTPVLVATPSGLNYTWTTSGGAIIGSVNNQSIYAGAAGLYSVYVYNPSTGCFGSAQFTVGTNTITPVVSASAGGSLNCSNTSVALTGTSSVISNVSYQWLGGVCGSSVTLNSTACNPGIYTLQVTNLINGCVGNATVQVISDANYISATVTPLDILDCNTNTVQVTVNTNTTVHQYNWTGPGIVSGQGSPTITVNAPGVYSVAVTNTVTGCTVGIQTIVVQTTSLFVNLTGTNVICSGNSAVLIASGATSYTWSTGATTNSITVAPTSNTLYTVTGQDGSCTGSTLISISVLPSPTVTAASSSASMSPGGSVQFTASGAVNYTWTPSSGLSNPNVFNPIATPAQSTTYCVEGSNLNGCRDTACVKVQVRECGNLFVPNIFSPNGDGVNDYFCLMGWKCLKIKKFNMTIYNRWGEKICESDYAGYCWNGIVEGEVVSGNSYVYYIYILEDNGTETVLTGDVTVVK